MIFSRVGIIKIGIKSLSWKWAFSWLGWVVFAMPLTLMADPAGPVDGLGENFQQPQRLPTTVVPAVWPHPHHTVSSDKGVHQRLLHPVNFRVRDNRLPDFRSMKDVKTKKTEFFKYLKPMVKHENDRLLAVRERLGYIQEILRFKRALDDEDMQWLKEVTEEFRVKQTNPYTKDFWDPLLERVDTIPVDLVLVQAANESAWGTSRFAREGNNLFGQWCFRPGCGLVPEDRPDGATYEVAAFDSINDSIRAYMNNLNTGRAYWELRAMRKKCRKNGTEPEASELAKGLKSYSERGMAYVTEIRAMLKHNAPVIAQVGPQ